MKSKAHQVLEQLYREFHHPQFLTSDPLWYAHQYKHKADQEVVAFICACFAFGNVTSIKKTLEFILHKLGDKPAETLMQSTSEELSQFSAGFIYRWIQGDDLALYLYRMGELLRRYGSLEKCFLHHDQLAGKGVQITDISVPHQAHAQVKNNVPMKYSVPHASNVLPRKSSLDNITTGLAGFTAEYQSIHHPQLILRKRILVRRNGESTSLSPSANTLLPMVAAGSACKRTFLFMRWVCRPCDGIDLGLWSVDPSRLVMPVDTHVFQAAKILRLTSDKSPSLAMAKRLTKRFSRYDSQDPTRFDFSLTRPGIMGLRDYLKRKIPLP
ncbi:MAG: TIGR02757 family protein [Sumerlaeia bacterium]